MKFVKPLLRLSCFFLFVLSLGFPGSALAQHEKTIAEPEAFRGEYAVKGDDLAIWNGSNYIPVFIKGINLGVSVPGTQPGQLAATAEDYSRWFELIKEAGYNTIRLYTLHFPRFYQELRRFNLEHPQNPLLVMHGVWLEENEAASDLFLQSNEFDQEIRDVISAVHGDIIIDQRFGKAYGDFNADISPWVIAFLPGREIFPGEVKMSNENNPDATAYEGPFFQLPAGDPTEVWLAQRLDRLVQFEYMNYGTLRPAGFSSWPTLDPITHPTEQMLPGSSEDSEQIDLSNMVSADSSAGFFIGYHAYPYYPDFIIMDPNYQAESDAWGPNSYLGYLEDLKAHYQGIPLIIAEFGVPSSWGSGHQSPTGMNHGGLSEEQQGQYVTRMFGNIEDADCAGGLQFSLIDEWFKQTWITNPYSNKDYRHLWHNITSPEQNFGILAYAPPPDPYKEAGVYPGKPITKVELHSDYTFFRIRLHMRTGQYRDDTLWVAFDTYESNLGESVLPDGRSIGVSPDTLRAEFALQIPLGSDMARLFVLPDYDIYGVKSLPQLDTIVSSTSNAGQWNPVRWKTNYFYNRAQYIGELTSSTSDDPYQFLNAVTRFNDSLEIRIPWTLLNFSAPTVRRAMHFQSHMEGADLVVDRQDTLSDGIALTLSLQDELYQTTKYLWSPWDYEKIYNDPPIERKKQSFHLLKQTLPQFNSPPIGRSDTFLLSPGASLEHGSEGGVLQNDFDIDGNEITALLSFGSGTSHGALHLHPDGSFLYTPDPGFKGEDFFMYYLDDGRNYSSLVPVTLNVGYPLGSGQVLSSSLSTVFPNPGDGHFCISISEPFLEAHLRVLDMLGREILLLDLEESSSWVDLEGRKPGLYLFNLSIDQNQEQHRILLQ